MKINIYYGGRGLIGDPTLYVIHKMQKVLEELNVTVEKYDLYESKNAITTLPNTLKDADGIILASTVEWYGIGGYMQTFLDACWLYADKEKLAQIYMCPVVMSTTYGERDGKLTLATAWEILGGRPCSGICGYIPEISMLECKEEYDRLIEKKAENMYRTINQKLTSFPASNQAVKQKVSYTQNIALTPQETEQLSMYASDDNYVQRQKEDIKELTNMFKDMMENREADEKQGFTEDFISHFKPQAGFSAIFRVVIKNYKKPMIIRVQNSKFECFYGTSEYADVELQTEENVISDIISGKTTFQNAFMNGNMTMKGDFKLLRNLDHIFTFSGNVEDDGMFI